MERFSEILSQLGTKTDAILDAEKLVVPPTPAALRAAAGGRPATVRTTQRHAALSPIAEDAHNSPSPVRDLRGIFSPAGGPKPLSSAVVAGFGASSSSSSSSAVGLGPGPRQADPLVAPTSPVRLAPAQPRSVASARKHITGMLDEMTSTIHGGRTLANSSTSSTSSSAGITSIDSSRGFAATGGSGSGAAGTAALSSPLQQAADDLSTRQRAAAGAAAPPPPAAAAAPPAPVAAAPISAVTSSSSIRSAMEAAVAGLPYLSGTGNTTGNTTGSSSSSGLTTSIAASFAAPSSALSSSYRPGAAATGTAATGTVAVHPSLAAAAAGHRVDAAVALVAARNDEIKRQNEALARQGEELRRLREEVAVAQATILGFKHAAQQLQAENDALRATARAAETDAIQWRARLDAAEAARRTAAAEADALRRDLLREQAANSGALAAVHDSRAASDAASLEGLQLRGELAWASSFVQQELQALTATSGGDASAFSDGDHACSNSAHWWPHGTSSSSSTSSAGLRRSLEALVRRASGRIRELTAKAGEAASQHATNVAELQRENRRLRALFGTLIDGASSSGGGSGASASGGAHVLDSLLAAAFPPATATSQGSAGGSATRGVAAALVSPPLAAATAAPASATGFASGGVLDRHAATLMRLAGSFASPTGSNSGTSNAGFGAGLGSDGVDAGDVAGEPRSAADDANAAAAASHPAVGAGTTTAAAAPAAAAAAVRLLSLVSNEVLKAAGLARVGHWEDGARAGAAATAVTTPLAPSAAALASPDHDDGAQFFTPEGASAPPHHGAFASPTADADASAGEDATAAAPATVAAGAAASGDDAAAAAVAATPYRRRLQLHGAAGAPATPAATGGPSLLAVTMMTTPAHVSAAVAAARAQERERVMAEVVAATAAAAAAQRTADREARDDELSALATALAAAKASLAAVQRERDALVETELPRLQAAWAEERAAWQGEMAALEAQVNEALAAVQTARGEAAAARAMASACKRDASAAREETRAAKAEASRAQAGLQATIARLTTEVSTGARQLQEALSALESQRAASERSQAAAVARARDEATRAARAAMEAEVEEAVAIAIEDAETRERGVAAARLTEAEARLAAAHAAALGRERRQAEEDAERRLAALAAAKEAAQREAVESVRRQEAQAYASQLADARHDFATKRAALLRVVGEAQEAVRREVERRRRLQSRVMDLQGNIRVHVRIRPTEEQKRQLAAAAAEGEEAVAALLQQASAAAVGTTTGSSSGSSSGDDAMLPTIGGGGGGSSGGAFDAATAGTLSLLAASRREALAAAGGGAFHLHDGIGDGSALASAGNPNIRLLGEGQLLIHTPYGMRSGTGSGSDAATPTASSFAATSLAPVGGSLAASGGQGSNRRTHWGYEMDDVHSGAVSQEALYEAGVRPLIEAAMQGVNVCVFAYGQTGSGKTHTMQGTHADPGVTPRALAQIFDAASAASVLGSGGGCGQWRVAISMMEVYQERVRDLLPPAALAVGKPAAAAGGAAAGVVAAVQRSIAGIGVGGVDGKWSRGLRADASTASAGSDADNLPVREVDGLVEVMGLNRVPVATVAEALAVIRAGSAQRATGSHALNDQSSRSHMIVRVHVERLRPASGDPDFASVINLVDLAGSERVHRTGVEGEALKEAAAINSSLSKLGAVISALRKGSPHIPFRDSKLTFLLKDSLIGGSKVLMLCCISPEDADASETLNSLTFAQRCRATALGRAASPGGSVAASPSPASSAGGGAPASASASQRLKHGPSRGTGKAALDTTAAGVLSSSGRLLPPSTGAQGAGATTPAAGGTTLRLGLGGAAAGRAAPRAAAPAAPAASAAALLYASTLGDDDDDDGEEGGATGDATTDDFGFGDEADRYDGVDDGAPRVGVSEDRDDDHDAGARVTAAPSFAAPVSTGAAARPVARTGISGRPLGRTATGGGATSGRFRF